MQPIPLDVIRKLLNEDGAPAPTRKQYGPLRRYDTEMRCTRRRCGSSTYYKVNGMSRCMTHALMDLNELVLWLLNEHKEGGVRTRIIHVQESNSEDV